MTGFCVSFCPFHTYTCTRMSCPWVSCTFSVSLVIVGGRRLFLGRSGICRLRIHFALFCGLCFVVVFIAFLSVIEVGGPTPHASLDPVRHRTRPNVRKGFCPASRKETHPPHPSGVWGCGATGFGRLELTVATVVLVAFSWWGWGCGWG